MLWLTSHIISTCLFAVVPKQVDYINEVKEFEAEMRKHSHRFPHDILTYTHDIVLLLHVYS